MSSAFSTQRYNPLLKQNPTYTTLKRSHNISEFLSTPSYTTSKWPDSIVSKTSTAPSSIEPIIERDSIEEHLADLPLTKLSLNISTVEEEIKIGDNLFIHFTRQNDPFLFSQGYGALCHIYDAHDKPYKVWDSCIPTYCYRDYRPMAKTLKMLVHELKLRNAPLGSSPMSRRLAHILATLLEQPEDSESLKSLSDEQHHNHEDTPAQAEQTIDEPRPADVDSDDEESDYGSNWFSRFGHSLCPPPLDDSEVSNAVPEVVGQEFKITSNTITHKSAPELRDGENRLVKKNSSSSYLATKYGKLEEISSSTFPEVVPRNKLYSQKNPIKAEKTVWWTNHSSKSSPVVVTTQISGPKAIQKKSPDHSYTTIKDSHKKPLVIPPTPKYVDTHRQEFNSQPHLQVGQRDYLQKEPKVKVKAQEKAPKLGFFSRISSFVRLAIKKNGLERRERILEWRRTVRATEVNVQN